MQDVNGKQENKYIDSKKGEVNMSTVAIKNTMVMNNTEKKAGLVERFKKYVLDNAEYFAVASAVMSGNGYAAGQIMRDARRVASANR